MKESGILFRPTMVRGILDDIKLITRRPIKKQPALVSEVQRLDHGKVVPVPVERWEVVGPWCHFYAPLEDSPGKARTAGMWTVKSRYGAVGDLLWVREAFSYWHGRTSADVGGSIWYWADGNPEDGDWTRPKPSIHMPRWASRILLRVEELRVERLRDISEHDAQWEGMPKEFRHSIAETVIKGAMVAVVGRDEIIPNSFRGGFANHWDRNAQPGFGWNDNPFVWVIRFKVLQKRRAAA